jgi:isopenicillin-N N-acyltransferase-like protein
MNKDSRLKIVSIKGNHRQMGRQIGEACRDEIQRMLVTYKDSLATAYDELQLTWDDAVLQGQKYFPYALEGVPQYVEELEGMAEASGVSLNDLMVLNCMEGITSDALHLGCTSIAVSGERTRNRHVLVGHNEDWLPEDEENTYLVHAAPDDEAPFLAITYGGLLPNIGFNAHGLAQCCDTVYPDDPRVGIARVFVSRAVLAAPRLADAIRRCIVRNRAAGYNHLIVDRSGEMYNVEVSARQFTTIYGQEGYLAHTNDYRSVKMRAVEDGTEDLIGSHVRGNRATRLLASSTDHTPESLQAILSDHVNYPYSICAHTVVEDSPLDRDGDACLLGESL